MLVTRSIVEPRANKPTAKNVPGTVHKIRYHLSVDGPGDYFEVTFLQKHIESNAIDFIAAPSLIAVSPIS